MRRATRGPQRKRFYKEAGVAEAEGGFAVTLDGKPIRTPSGRQVVAPTARIADAIAAEWEAQGETIDPLTMPLTRFANSVVEVVDRVDAVGDDIAKYFGIRFAVLSRRPSRGAGRARSRALGSRAVLGREDLGAHFILSEGIVHVAQPEQAIKAARAALSGRPLVGRGAACGDDADRLGAAGAGAAAWRAATPTRSGPPPMSMRTGTSSNGAWTRRWRLAGAARRSISEAAVALLAAA